MKTKRLLCRLAIFLLTAIVALQPALALGEADGPGGPASDAETAEPAATKYVATASVALKVRRGPGKEHSGADSIPKDALVYILELGDEWAKVETSRAVGYVQTRYLDDIREYDAKSQSVGKAVQEPRAASPEGNDGLAGDKSSFREGYYAYAVKTALIYLEPDERTRIIAKVPTYKQVVVSEIDGDWCYARYGNTYGYIRVDSLFKWDRIDPYIGEIPGLVVYPLMVFVGKTTNIYSLEDNTVLKTVNPGSALCVEEPDENGRYLLPYWRTTGYVMKEDVVYEMRVTPYEDAKPGDLISVMSTYYAVGVSTLNYQGRNWNIYLASSMISGTVLQPGEDFDQYECIGPYRKSTGYHRAPIMSQTALWGYGGGTCQVNTTFYIANIQLPILITHRKVHAEVGIYYCKKGFDAAVGGGDINLTLTNTLPYAIRYQFFMSDGVLTCCVFREG